MDKNHFILRKRYKVVLKNGISIPLNLKPENKYYFEEQEQLYIIDALRYIDIDMNDVKEIITYFIPEETEEPVKIVIGL